MVVVALDCSELHDPAAHVLARIVVQRGVRENWVITDFVNCRAKLPVDCCRKLREAVNCLHVDSAALRFENVRKPWPPGICLDIPEKK
jgi:hypothetical protein